MIRDPWIVFRGGTLIFMVSLAVGTGEGTGTQPPRQLEKESVSISEARKDDDGFLVHQVESSYQAASTEIRGLLPEPLRKDERYPVIYVLPVEVGRDTRYGDGLKEVKRLGLHRKHRAVFVAPTFSDIPFYVDHPTSRGIRQESHFVKVVVPFVDKTWPVRPQRSGRMLLGFSKSGYGAVALLLRHPDLFARASAWDSPLMREQLPPQRLPIYGTEENFRSYQIVRLLKQQAAKLKNAPRLQVLGHNLFREQSQQFHTLLEELKIPHTYQNQPFRTHSWNSGWLADAVSLLLSIPKEPENIED